MPFMLQAGILFGLCSAVLVGVSLVTPPPQPQRVQRYCWKSPWAVVTEKPITGVFDPRVLAVLLVITMGVCYWIFA